MSESIIAQFAATFETEAGTQPSNQTKHTPSSARLRHGSERPLKTNPNADAAGGKHLQNANSFPVRM